MTESDVKTLLAQLRKAPARTSLILKAVLAHADTWETFQVGAIELRFTPDQVKMSVMVRVVHVGLERGPRP